MTSKGVAQLLADLGISQSHSRPRVSNDNPFSEAQFKTLKYHPRCPKFFENIEHAKSWARQTMSWYNEEHYHQGLSLMTPSQVHHGQASEIQARRQEAMDAAFEAHPESFVKGCAKVHAPPSAVFINKPKRSTETLH